MIILVGGQKSGSGKTTFICTFLKAFPDSFSVLKVTPNAKMQSKVETDIAILSEKGKDTALFLEYRAKKVVWVHGERKNIDFLLDKALNSLSGNILVEGNSAILSVNFDIAFFVSKYKEKITEKDSARIFKRNADFIIINTSETTPASIVNNIVYANLKYELCSPSENFLKIFNNILHLA